MSTQASPPEMEEEEDFGLIRPSLIKQLKAILYQYPDSGQILKEILQNAEDAGAKSVKFLYDENNCEYDASQLSHPGLAEFQGPALYAYNDAQFKEPDWRGVRMLQDSIKEKEPLKVGRFGLGFKSVLHITDLPTILSGDRLAVIDPHEKYFTCRGEATTGYIWRLPQRRLELERTPHHYAAFTGKFGCTANSLLEGQFRGTIFRFPLRLQPSKLSDTVYTKEKVYDLFSSFEAEAPLLLLFLKSVETVEVLHLKPGQQEPELLFSVSLDDSCREAAREKRINFMAAIDPSRWLENPVHVVYNLNVAHMHTNDENTDRNVHQYLVVEYYVGGSASETMQTLHQNKALSLIPLVGVAMTIDSSKPPPESNEAEVLENSKPAGQVFCFLPLRAEQRSDSGLPVHINGYFSVSQNRHSLNLPSAGQAIDKDPGLAWNHCLLTEAVPAAYRTLILHAVLCVENNMFGMTTQDVYAAFPNMEEVHEQWKGILEPLFRELFNKAIFHSPGSKSGRPKWVKVNDAIFDCMPERQAIEKATVTLLREGGVHVVDCPKYLLHALEAFSMGVPRSVTPDLLRQILRQQPTLLSPLQSEHKLLLLEYALKDEQFQDLHHIALLPLASGHFTEFSLPGRVDEIFLVKDESEQVLMGRLAAQMLLPDLNENVSGNLKKLADAGSTQVKILAPSHVTTHLPKMLPEAWSRNELTQLHLEEDKDLVSWLETLWCYLRQHYPNDLSCVTGLPILAVRSGVHIVLHKLSSPSKVVLLCAMGITISEAAQEGLQCLGVELVLELHPAVASHAGILGPYVHTPLPVNLLQAALVAHKTMGNTAAEKLSCSSCSSREDLSDLWSKLVPTELMAEGKGYICNLPLFPLAAKVNDPVEYASSAMVNLGAPLEMPPVLVPLKMLDLRNEVPRLLAKLLGIQPMMLSQYLMHHMFPNICLFHKDKESMMQIMSYVMDRLPLLLKEDPGFKNCLKSLAFVENVSGDYKVPSDLFDPENTLVKQFFINDDVFPVGQYQQTEFLALLRPLGLRGAAQIQASHVLLAMNSLQQMKIGNEQDSVCTTKANAVFQYLNSNAHQLREIVDGQPLIVWIRNMTWVTTLKKQPKPYPDNLPWFDSTSLEVPTNVFSPDWSSLVGSVAPVMSTAPSTHLAEALGWHQPPSLDLVLQQLNILINQFVPADKARFLTIIASIYDHLSSQSRGALQASLAVSGLTTWVWNGEGFSEAKTIVVKRYQMDLSPYCYSLPSEISLYQDMFVHCGAACEVTDDVLVMVLTSIKNKYCEEMEGDGSGLKIPEPGKQGCARDLQMCITILNILKLHVTSMSPDLLSRVLVPVQCEQGNVSLMPVKDCTYCDVEWLRQGFHPMLPDESDGIYFIHPNLPVLTAETLGVPTLMSRMLHAEELEVTCWGQQESLTDRIHQLLEDYTDGFAIPKELVQNADDAGASTVKFLYDERQNEEFMTYLLDEGMKHCQGPALWVYNDAMFTDQDLINITKLGCATKEAEQSKIGRFGLGFNAVYNITDVPSFLSQNWLVIFDPHMTHLGHAMRDRSRPGIRIDLQSQNHKTLIRKLPDQFEPYQKIFGCQIGGEAENFFRGTLFRLPLRDLLKAQKSEISKLHYDRKEIMHLLSFLVQGAQNLVLFTQNVKNIEVFHLPADEKNPDNARQILSLEKELLSPVSLSGDMKSFSNSVSRILPVGAKYMEDIKNRRGKFEKSQIPSATSVVKMTVSITENGEMLTSQKASLSEQLWLISNTVGQKQSLSLGLGKHGSLIPVASVAAPLCRNNNVLQAVTLESIGQKGHLFCFLPLPIESGLPVHVNGAFALQSNRRYLCEQIEDDKFCAKAEWNKALLQDAVVLAYEKLLLDLCQLPQNGAIVFTELWPNSTDALPVMLPLVQQFYGRLPGDAQSIPVCYDGEKQVPICDAVFLDPVLRENPQIGDKAMDIFEQFSLDSGFVFDLSKLIRQTFVATGQQHFINEKTFCETEFFAKVFFKHITNIEMEPRDALMCYVLDRKCDHLNVLAMASPCIPVSPEGKTLKYPNETIHPSESAAVLYVPDDERFPFDKEFCSESRLSALEKLGMQSSDLHWKDIYDRAESIASLREADPIQMKKRQGAFLEFLDKKLKKIGSTNQSGDGGQAHSDLNAAGEKLQRIAFLSPLKKPVCFPLQWHGEHGDENVLLSSEQLYPKDSHRLLSCSQYIADELEMTPEIKSFLGFANKQIQVEFVLTQFNHVLQVDLAHLSEAQYECLHNVFNLVCFHLQQKCQTNPKLAECISSAYQERPCILLGKNYVRPSEAAFTLDSDCTPYLFLIPPDIQGQRLRPFYTVLGVKDNLSITSFAVALQKMQKNHDGKCLKGHQLKTSLNLVRQLDACICDKDLTMDQTSHLCGTIYLPDNHGVLRESSTLRFNDCPWLDDVKNTHFTHKDVTLDTSEHLGVMTKSREALTKHSQGIPFGQKENLIGSLKRVLKNYPLDHGIFKEYIQNADDAAANELHFVLDKRTHPSKRIFGPSWEPLQGPGLCIYNDGSFSLADLEAIQKLGCGSKTHDPNKTGEYGIGFTASYHLTDAPSLLVKGNEVGDTLCVFDPQCRFVPGATVTEPGMRYTDLDELRGAFPDVFSVYLEDKFCGRKCTTFRLPLRSNDMAGNSTISHVPVTLIKMKGILDEMQREAFDILLFTNNLRELSFSDNLYSGLFDFTYTVKSTLQPMDEEKRSGFFSYVRKVGHQIKEGSISIEAITCQDVMYDVVLSDNLGVQEVWRVCQRIGLSSDKALPAACKQAFDYGNLCLLPRGGTACLIKRCGYISVNGNLRAKKVFCSLPLPQEISLPMNINGHFALGFENRRHLWRSENDDFRQAWNNFLFCDVITPCYLRTMKSMRLHNMPAQFHDDVASVVCSWGTLEQSIKTHQKLFPAFNPALPEWDVLVKAVLLQSAELDVPILPSILQDGTSQWQVTWLPPCGKGHKKAFFTKEEDSKKPPLKVQQSEKKNDQEVLKEVLLTCGLKLVEACPKVIDSFQQAGVDIQFISPAGVNMFLQSCTSDEPMGYVGQLPCELKETPFNNSRALQIVLNFCKSDPDFVQKLEGLPLCYTADRQLRVFQASDPKFPPEHKILVRKRDDLFLHHDYSVILQGIDVDDTPVLKRFNIEAFASLLHHVLDVSVFCQNPNPVQWKMKFNSFPNEHWMQRVWEFLRKEIVPDDKSSKTSGEVVSGLNKKEIRQALASLSQWCILPATCRGTPKLYSLTNGDQVLDLRSSKLEEAVEFLRKLGVPQLDTHSLDNTLTNLENAKFARNLTTTMNDPVGILKAAHLSCLSKKDHSHVDLVKGQELLHYFNKHMANIQKEDGALAWLRQLPIYRTINGDVISLSGCLVYTLPAGIPVKDMDVWRSKFGTVFLADDPELETLYSALGTVAVNGLDAYCKFILQHFELISHEARLVHLHYLYTTYLQVNIPNKLSKTDEDRLLDCLRNLCFLQDEDGKLCTASEFFDPEHQLFKNIKSQHELPPRACFPFCESEWLSLLRMMGLQSKLTSEMCLELASEIALLGKDPESARALAKSKVLIKHLLNIDDAGYRNAILASVAHVPFVPAEKASDQLLFVYDQHGDSGDGKLPYFCFKDSFSKDHEKLIWTLAPILPSWADPSKQIYASQQNVTDIQQCLGMHAQPPIELVVHHFRNLCRHMITNYKCLPEDSVLIGLLKPIYKYLQEHKLDNPDSLKDLVDLACVLVKSPVRLTKACFTVFNIGHREEIDPYLFRVPSELGECHELFLQLGAQENATLKQYSAVLECMHNEVPNEPLTANELGKAYKAIKGLADGLLKVENASVQTKSLFLPDEKGKLRDVAELVFNDAPAYNERVQEFGILFLFDMSECGIEHHHIEEVFKRLPSDLRPSYLSDLVKETLVKSSKESVNTDGLASTVSHRLQSELFQKAVSRLAHHEAYKTGQHLEGQILANALDRLCSIQVSGVQQLQTHLIYKGCVIPGSEMQKSCFIEKVRSASNMDMWNIYLAQAASLSQGLQILLAGAVNTILGGLLRDSTLFLLPLLTCNEDDMWAELDASNVRMDRTSSAARVRTLPAPGDTIPNQQKQWISDTPGGDLSEGEFVAFKGSLEEDFIYALVEEEHVNSTENDPDVQEHGKHYSINLGPRKKKVECSVYHNLHKIVRFT